MNGRGKPNGVYPNPWDDCSRTFFYCSNEYVYEYVSRMLIINERNFEAIVIAQYQHAQCL